MKQATTPTAITAVRDARAASAAAEVVVPKAVVAWAVEYRIDQSVVDDLTFGADAIGLGGVGCPLVSEFDAYDLAAGLGMSSEGGAHYILRRTWERVVALQVPVWKAFRVTEHTMSLNPAAASYVDQMLAPTLHSCSFAQIERTVTQAIDTYDPEEAERRRRKAADDRSFDIHFGGRDTNTTGTADVTGTLAIEDALDLEKAVKDGARVLGELGCEESLDVRRSMAVGEMARHQLAFNLEHGDSDDLGAGGGGRGVNLYAHLDPHSDHATLDNTGGGDVLIEQIKAWCQSVGNTVTITKVIDLNTQLSTNAYTPTEKLIEQIRLRDQVCVFPHGTRRARYCDLDHRIPYNRKNPRAGGQTTTENLALLCRKHHRAKTFSAWDYTSPQPGVYDWTSPSGQRFQVTRGRRHGRMPITTPIDDDPPPPEP